METVFVSWAVAAAESVFTTLFPSDCRICGSPLVRISRLPVCDECLAALRPIAGSLCALCGERLVSPYAAAGEHGEPMCGLCRRMKPAYDKAAAYGSYEGGLRDLIHLLKYQQVRPAASVLGRMLAEVIEHLSVAFEGARPLVVPVPLHERKLQERGFNQSELIARAALKLRPANLDLKLHAGVVVRSRATQSQTGLSSHQRRANIRGAFVIAQPEQVSGRQVVLIDDVFTTGTTVSECARLLRRAGATRVWVATAARTLKLEAAHADIASQVKEGMDESAHAAMAAHV